MAPAFAEAAPFDKGPYLQNVSATSVTVMWESSPPRAGVVELLDANGGEPARVLESPVSEIHEVVIDQLDPGSRYRYRVEVGEDSVTGEFATAPPAGAPFSFVVFGDTRSNHADHQRVVERIRGEVPDFLLGTGDMVNEGGSESDWQRFFDIERDLLRDNVLFPIIGNHDRQGRGRTADNYRKYFAVPENSPDPERYYAATFGNARILGLDSNSYSFALTDQTAWIERQLQAARLDPNIEHIFVAMHHPPFSVALHGGHKELREAWTPLFETYQVTAVFSGHDHVYSRGEKNGVRYFVTGGGGAPLYPRKRRSDTLDEAVTAYFERVHHYVRVHVVGNFIEATAIRADGSIIETVSWGAQPRDPNALLKLLESPDGPGKERAAGGPEPAEASSAARAAAIGAPARRIGWAGILGGLLMLMAGGLLVWTLRS
jgi:acid phosphatase type 7